MSHWLVYWVLMLDGVNKILGISITMFFVMIIIAGICAMIGNCDHVPSLIKFSKALLKIFVPLIFLFLILFALIPTTKQMAAIYLIPQIASNKDIKQLPPKLSKLALEYVNKELNLEEKKL